MHVIAAKAVAFEEALRPDFKVYGRKVVDNAQALAEAMVAGGLDLVSGGTDSHLVLVDLRPKGVTGKAAAASLERAGITCNMNSIPFDPEKRTITSGIRLGSAAATTRGFTIAEFQQTGRLIVEVLDGLQASPEDNRAVEEHVRAQVEELCAAFPIYQVTQIDGSPVAIGLPGRTGWRRLRHASATADTFSDSDPTHLPMV